MGLLAAVLLALALRLTLAAAVAPQRLGGDPRVYDATAAAIAAGHGFSLRRRPTALHPPGWPYLLGAAYALTGHSAPADQARSWTRRHPGRALAVAHRRWLVGRAVSALLGALAAGLLGLLALELFGPAVAVTAAALAAVATPLAVSDLALESEPLFVALALAALLAAARLWRSGRLRWAVAAGLLAGLATLTRANGAVLLVPLALAAWPGCRWRGLAALLCAFALAIVPWTVRNAVELHALVPVSTDLGKTLAGTYNATAPPNRYRWRGPQRLPAADRAAARTRPEAARDRALTRLALRYIAAHPPAVIKAMAWNTARMLEIDPVSRAILGVVVASRALAIASIAGFALLAVLAVLGLLTRTARAAPLWLWTAPVVLWLGTAPFAVNFERFRWPLDPFLVLLAACALVAAARRARPRAAFG
jgi:hypothetical protein